MERRGGLCIARYGAEPDAAWKLGRIMLRYRPIAPKPAAGGGAAVPPPPADARGGARGKRKGGARGDGRKGRKSRKTLAAATATCTSNDGNNSPVSHPLSSSPSSSSNSYSSGSPPRPAAAQNVVTLPLMPETPERREEKVASPLPSPPPLELALPCLSHLWQPEPAIENAAQRPSPVEVVAPRPIRPAGSWVTLECVEETWREGEQYVEAHADEEVRRDISGQEACPAFITDKYDRVIWMNEAYKKKVVGAEEDEEVRVALVRRCPVPAGRAFMCRVRVRNASRRGRGTLATPCDVWRFEDGSLAWRLDVKAALSLGIL